MSLLRSLGVLQKGIRIQFNTTKLRKASMASRFNFSEKEERWRQSDGLSRKWKLIYKAPLDNSLNYMTTYLTISTSIIAIGGIYFLITVDKEDLEKPVMASDTVVLANNRKEALIYLFTFIAFHFSLKLLLSRFVIRLYQDGDKYIAIFRSHMYNSIKQHEFNLNEFKRRNPPFAVSWGDARFSLGRKHAIILENHFKAPAYFNYLLNKKKPEDMDFD